jgi:hypothetical protein
MTKQRQALHHHLLSPATTSARRHDSSRKEMASVRARRQDRRGRGEGAHGRILLREGRVLAEGLLFPITSLVRIRDERRALWGRRR